MTRCAYRGYLLDWEVVVQLRIYTQLGRRNVERTLLCGVVERDSVRVVVVAGMRSLEMALVATLVVALTTGATVGVMFAVDMARNGNVGRTAYPHEIYSQHGRYLCRVSHSLFLVSCWSAINS